MAQICWLIDILDAVYGSKICSTLLLFQKSFPFALKCHSGTFFTESRTNILVSRKYSDVNCFQFNVNSPLMEIVFRQTSIYWSCIKCLQNRQFYWSGILNSVVYQVFLLKVPLISKSVTIDTFPYRTIMRPIPPSWLLIVVAAKQFAAEPRHNQQNII